MGVFYKLENRQVVPSDLYAWAASREDPKGYRVAETYIDDVRVSTVFLGVDHSFDGGPPLLFETMVFGGPLDEEQERCSTWAQAEAMHAAMCDRVRASFTTSGAHETSPERRMEREALLAVIASLDRTIAFANAGTAALSKLIREGVEGA